jgi:hypothetical protein
MLVLVALVVSVVAVASVAQWTISLATYEYDGDSNNAPARVDAAVVLTAHGPRGRRDCRRATHEDLLAFE